MFRMIAIVAIAATVVGVLGHLVVFGAVKVSVKQGSRSIRRFSIWERFIHSLTVLGFLTLGVTGMIAVFQGEKIHGWLWFIHAAAAPCFVAGLTAIVLTWSFDGKFAPHDWEWAKVLGGYIWKAHPPAGRFNGGQKAYFWAVGGLGLVMLLTGLGRIYPVFGPFGQEILYQVHRYAALAFILAGITHLYLGTLANPGTIGAMLTGRVTPEWAQTHHSVWWGDISKSGK